MASIATNLFRASTNNENDLEKIEQFLDDEVRDSMFTRDDCIIEGEFLSRYEFPEKEADKLIASLEAPSELYLCVLTHDLSDGYASLRIFCNGRWDIKF